MHTKLLFYPKYDTNSELIVLGHIKSLRTGRRNLSPTETYLWWWGLVFVTMCMCFVLILSAKGLAYTMTSNMIMYSQIHAINDWFKWSTRSRLRDITTIRLHISPKASNGASERKLYIQCKIVLDDRRREGKDGPDRGHLFRISFLSTAYATHLKIVPFSLSTLSLRKKRMERW